MTLRAAPDNGLQLPWMAGVLIHQMVGWPIVLYLAVRSSGTTWKQAFPLQRFPIRLVLPVTTLCVGLAILLIQIGSLIPQPELLHRMNEEYLSSPGFLTWMSTVVVGPICEEAFHRGWLLTGLRARYSTRKAIVVSAAVFALFHLNPWQAVIAFPIGILFAWLVVRTGSLGPSILGHAVANATGDGVNAILRQMGYSDASIQEMTYLPPVLLIAGGLLAIVGWFFLARAVGRKPAAVAQD